MVFPVLLAAEEPWSMADGGTMTGSLVSYRNGTVILATPGAGRQLLQIEAFSPESRARIRAQFPGGDRAEQKTAKTEKAAPPERTRREEAQTGPPEPPRAALPHLANRSIGAYPPDFRVTLPGSPESVDFATFRGKLVLVHFFSSQVELSVQSLPYLTALHEKYGPHGLQMIYIAMERNRNVSLAIRGQVGITWPGNLDRDGKLAKAWGVQMLPTVVLVNQAGVIVSDNRRISEIEPEIRKHLGLPPEE